MNVTSSYGFTYRGQRIAYSTAGNPSAPPIVLVHGLMSSRAVWGQTIGALEANYYCVSLDLLGMGESAKPADGDYSIPEQGKLVLALADRLGIERFRLIGHSMGGQIALTIAALLAPERVERLVNVAGVASGQLELYPLNVLIPRVKYLGLPLPFLWDMKRWYGHLMPSEREEFDTFFASLPRALLRENQAPHSLLDSALRCGEAIRKFNVVPYLHQISAPTLTIFGKRDAIVPMHEGFLVQENLPDSRLELIDQCGHFVMFDQPERFLELLLPFIDG